MLCFIVIVLREWKKPQTLLHGFHTDNLVALAFDKDQGLAHVNYLEAPEVLSFNYKKKEFN